MKHIIVSLIILICSTSLFPQFGSQDSGGPLTPEWAAYDVKFYNINLNINPDKQTINGWVGVTVEAVSNMKEFVLDLDDKYRITKIIWDSPTESKEISFKHENGKIKIQLPEEVAIGQSFTVKIYYNGKPGIAKIPHGMMDSRGVKQKMVITGLELLVKVVALIRGGPAKIILLTNQILFCSTGLFR
ncbi:MAG: hypothetical protein M5T52_16845 [Ignavibacteriaceae bacterium]|nr:hypothetical protein [Ignavibacteriaceae bacterium]